MLLVVDLIALHHAFGRRSCSAKGCEKKLEEEIFIWLVVEK